MYAILCFLTLFSFLNNLYSPPKSIIFRSTSFDYSDSVDPETSELVSSPNKPCELKKPVLTQLKNPSCKPSSTSHQKNLVASLVGKSLRLADECEKIVEQRDEKIDKFWLKNSCDKTQGFITDVKIDCFRKVLLNLHHFLIVKNENSCHAGFADLLERLFCIRLQNSDKFVDLAIASSRDSALGLLEKEAVWIPFIKFDLKENLTPYLPWLFKNVLNEKFFLAAMNKTELEKNPGLKYPLNECCIYVSACSRQIFISWKANSSDKKQLGLVCHFVAFDVEMAELYFKILYHPKTDLDFFAKHFNIARGYFIKPDEIVLEKRKIPELVGKTDSEFLRLFQEFKKTEFLTGYLSLLNK